MADEAAAAQEASHLPEAEWTAQASCSAAKEGANRLLETERTALALCATAVGPAHPFEILHPPEEEATVLEVQGAVPAPRPAGADEVAVIAPRLAKAADAARPFEA
eukprot:TRINITY_DN11875_c0_g2_i1.p2 TRINITY_DN11875_c0_g2~~TRINITY_DN11875_c0_g2_i1.p2  ORF type:complete len:106 (-),score=27.46 TRINITY_DN11875_c0_g2_i1:27-344(-)